VLAAIRCKKSGCQEQGKQEYSQYCFFHYKLEIEREENLTKAKVLNAIGMGFSSEDTAHLAQIPIEEVEKYSHLYDEELTPLISSTVMERMKIVSNRVDRDHEQRKRELWTLHATCEEAKVKALCLKQLQTEEAHWVAMQQTLGLIQKAADKLEVKDTTAEDLIMGGSAQQIQIRVPIEEDFDKQMDAILKEATRLGYDN
jgi:hypothetical protein